MEYLSDGITEDVIDRLSSLPNLRVISRTSAFRYKRRDIDPKKVAKELGIEALVMGRLIHRGNDVSVSAELVYAPDDKQLWGEHYTRKLAEITSVQQEIATSGSYSAANSIDNFGQVVGTSNPNDNRNNDGTLLFHPFIYSDGIMYDLNNLIPAGSTCVLVESGYGYYPQQTGPDINDAGQIAANANCSGQHHAVRLDPIYKTFVQQPINADGSSVFSAMTATPTTWPSALMPNAALIPSPFSHPARVTPVVLNPWHQLTRFMLQKIAQESSLTSDFASVVHMEPAAISM